MQPPLLSSLDPKYTRVYAHLHACARVYACVRVCLVVSHHLGADLEARDSNGNTVLHMCVLWKLKEMYAFLEEIGKKHGLKDLSMMQNNAEPGLAHGLTCMQLSVFNNDPDMFNWILERKRQLQWKYGRVSSSLVPLDEIDWVRGKESGAVELIVELNHRDLLKCGRINFLLDLKWEKFAGAIFASRFRKSMFFLLGFMVLTLRDKNTYELRSTVENVETVGLAILEVMLCIGTAGRNLAWNPLSYQESARGRWWIASPPPPFPHP